MTRTQSTDTPPPPDDACGRRLSPAPLALIGVFVALAAIGFFALLRTGGAMPVGLLQIALCFAGIAVAVVASRPLRKQATASVLPDSVRLVEAGSNDTRQRLDELTDLCDRQADCLRTLQALSTVAATSPHLEQLLPSIAEVLVESLGVHAVTIHLLDGDDGLRLVASAGLPASGEGFEPSPIEGRIARHDIETCRERVQAFIEQHGAGDRVGRALRTVAAPVQYQSETLGVFTVVIDHENNKGLATRGELLGAVGRHIAGVIERTNLCAKTSRRAIKEEQTRLAHELHDSLAQTIAGLRLQIRVLDQTLHQGEEAAIWHDLERVESSVDAANSELRAMIAHFRTPLPTLDLLPALDELIGRSCAEGGVNTFLQNQWRHSELSPEQGTHVLRIIQESLTNIHKHSQAKSARVLLSDDGDGNLRVLIEDDGSGFEMPDNDIHKGEHLGLCIMRERAARLHGCLAIDSEIGEGTQVVLSFPDPATTAAGRSPASAVE